MKKILLFGMLIMSLCAFTSCEKHFCKVVIYNNSDELYPIYDSEGTFTVNPTSKYVRFVPISGNRNYDFNTPDGKFTSHCDRFTTVIITDHYDEFTGERIIKVD